MTIEAGGVPVNAAQLSELRSNLGILDFAAGGQSVATSGQTLVFSNSNGLSFGLNADGGSVLTGSYTVPETSAFLTTAALSNHSHGNPSLALTNLGGTTASNSAGLTLSLSAAAQSVQTQNSVLVQGSSGSIVFSNSNGVSFGGNARTITASVETSYAGSNHSHGNPTLALTNLSGSTASASDGLTISLSAAVAAAVLALSALGSSANAGTVVFSNSNGISFGMNGSTITATVVPGAAAGLAAAQAGTQTATSGTLVFANSNGLTFGMSGSSQVTASHNGLTTAAASNHSHGDPTLALTNLSGTTASASNGLTLSLSAAAPVAQTNQTVGFFATGNTTQNSSSTFDARSITFNGLGAATLGFSGGSMQVSVPVQTVQTQGSVAVLGSTGAISFANSNGITFGANASTITASHNGITSQTAQTQSNVQGVIVSDTTYRTGDVSFKNANGISFGSSAGGGVVTASYTVPVQSAQTIGVYGSSNTTGQSSSSTVDARSLSFRGMGVASVGLSGGEVVISVPSGAADGVNVIAAGGRTATTNGTVVFSNSNGISFGLDAINGSQITASYTVPTQSAQTMGVYGSSQTYGQSSSSTVDARSLSVVGSGGVSVGMSAGSLLISGQTTAAQTAQSMGLYGSSQTYGQSSSSTVDARSLSIVGSGGISVGLSAGSLLISGQTTVAQSAQTQSNVQGIIVSDTTYRTGDVSFKNANGISFGSSGANVVTASYTVPNVAGFLTTARASNDAVGLNTAQSNVTWTVNSSGLSLDARGYAGTASTFNGTNVSGSMTMNSAGLRLDLSAGAGAALTISDAVTSGTAGRLAFTNLNGITLSLSTGAAGSHTLVGSHNAITTARASNDAIGLNTAQTNVTWTVNSSGLSFNAAGYAGTGTSKTGGAVMTLNSNGLQFDGAALAGTSSGFTGANISASITHNTAGLAMSMSVAAPGAATLSGYAVSNTTQSTSGTFPGAVSFQGAGGVSVGISNGSVVIQGPDLSSLSVTGALSASSNGSTISLGVGTVTMSMIGNTTQTSSGSVNLNALVMSGAGGVSLGVSAGSMIISAANPVSAGIGGIGATDTTYTSGTVSLVAGGGAISIGSQTGQKITFSVPQTSSLVGTSGVSVSTNGSTISVGLGTVNGSAIGNTTQTSSGSMNLSGLVFSGAGGVSVGFSAGSVIVSGATGGAGGGAAISAAGSSQNAGTIVFSNSNNVSFGMNGSTVTASAAAIRAIGASDTTYVSGSVSFVAGAGAITIGSDTGQRISFAVPATSSLVGVSGLSVSTNGSTISVYPGAVFRNFLWEPPGASSAGSAMTQGSMSFQKVVIPYGVSMTRVDIPVQISLASSATANTGNLLISSGLVIYSISGGSTLNPIVGAFGTTTYTHASNTANFNSITGPRLFSFPIATALSPGEYFVGVQLSTNNNSSIGTATTAIAATVSLQHGAIYTASQYAEFGAVTATSVNLRPFVGVAASVTATNQTQQMSNITQTGTALMRANIPVGFRA